MNAPFWLYETNVFHESDKVALSALKAHGYELKALEYYNLALDYPTLIPNSADRPVIVRGSIAMVIGLNRQAWVPGDWLNPDSFRCSTWMSAYEPLKNKVLNTQGFFLPLNLVRERFNELCSLWNTNELFIRPDHGIKSFSGQLFNLERLDREILFFVKNQGGNYGTMALVSPPVQAEFTEIRVVIANKQPISASIYRLDGELVPLGTATEHQLTEDELSLIKEVTSLPWEPAPIYILDLVRTDRDIAIMEINAFNTASLYGCNLTKVFKAAGDIAIQEFNDLKE